MSDSDSDAPPEASSSRYYPEAKRARHTIEGKANKNRPSQMSSKRAVSTLRVAPGLKANAEIKVRDPRFDPTADFNEEGWRKSYDFVFEKQREEAEAAQKALAVSKRLKKRKGHRGGAKAQRAAQKVIAPEQAAELKVELERTKNRLAAEQRKAMESAAKAAARRDERAAVKQGKKPFFAKKSDVREQLLLARYEDLKKAGKLDKFLTKKRKSLSGQGHT